MAGTRWKTSAGPLEKNITDARTRRIMISQLTGTVLRAALTETILDVQGVGYRVFIPMSTYEQLPAPGGKATLLTHLQVSENDISLFGFATERERSVFELLITVSGIGPKTALNILSSMNIPVFCKALTSGDLKSLKRIHGIGPKSAERMMVELRDKIEKIAPELSSGGAAGSESNASSPEMEDALLALEQLGFQRSKIQKAVEEIVLAMPEGQRSVENIVRTALRSLNR